MDARLGSMRFWLVPFALVLMVVVPFLIWGEALTALLAPGGGAAALDGYALAGWAIGVALLVADLFLPIPTTAIIAALGLLYGPVIGAAIGLIGSLAAALMGYALGRHLGRPAAARFLEDEATGAERLFARYGGWIVAASRWAPVLPEVVSVIAGVARMRLSVFTLAAICGAAPLSALFATIGWLGADAPGWTLAASALAPLLLWPLARRALRPGRSDQKTPSASATDKV